MKIVIFDGLSPLDTARVATLEEIRREHGAEDAAAILDGTHSRYRALYLGVFISKLESVLARVQEELET